MVSKKTVICNKSGLHARPAGIFVKEASKYASAVMIKKVGETKDLEAKSIIVILSLGLCQGDEVILSAAGEDEEKAVDELIALIESGFGEKED